MQHLQGLDKAYRNAIYICHNAFINCDFQWVYMYILMHKRKAYAVTFQILQLNRNQYDYHVYGYKFTRLGFKNIIHKGTLVKRAIK